MYQNELFIIPEKSINLASVTLTMLEVLCSIVLPKQQISLIAHPMGA